MTRLPRVGEVWHQKGTDQWVADIVLCDSQYVGFHQLHSCEKMISCEICKTYKGCGVVTVDEFVRDFSPPVPPEPVIGSLWSRKGKCAGFWRVESYDSRIVCVSIPENSVDPLRSFRVVDRSKFHEVFESEGES